MIGSFSVETILLLSCASGIAGIVDAIAGGGGLLTLPALLLAGVPPHQALATNKGQAAWGSTAALIRFSRSPLLDRKRVPVAFAAGAGGAIVGTLLVQIVPSAALRPLVLVLLIAAALAVLLVRPPPGGEARSRPAWITGLVAAALGGYDGFFGPGTGTFLILAFVLWWRDPFNAASANAKIVNCASNLGSLLVFALHGQVLWLPAVCMGAGQWVGGWFGAHLVIRRGQGLVRVVAACVSVVLVVRLLWVMHTAP